MGEVIDMADISKEFIDETLAHAGILGQRWHNRRYQNPDGTYTELGKIRKRAYYRDRYGQYSNEELKEMTERNKVINAYEQSVADQGIAKDNARTNRVSNASKRITSVSGGIKSTTAILTGSVALVAAGAAFAKAFSSGGEGRKNLDTIKNYTKKGVEYVKKLLKVNHSDIDENYLMHHGILGQKWGVRRFQNPDGTLTPLGRKRYGVGKYDELTPAQKRDIDKRDKELQAKEDAEKAAKAEAKKQKRDYKLEKYKLKNDAKELTNERKEVKAEERLEKAAMKAEAEERRQAEIDKKAERIVKSMAVGLAATTAIMGIALYRKARLSGTSTSKAKSSGSVVNTVKEKAESILESAKNKTKTNNVKTFHFDMSKKGRDAVKQTLNAAKSRHVTLNSIVQSAKSKLDQL